MFEFIQHVNVLIPQYIKITAFIVCIFIVLDTICGMWLSAKSKILSSKKARDKLAAKCLQYIIICTCAACGSAISNSWNILALGHIGIISIEFMSLVEIMASLQKAGGADVSRLNSLFGTLGQIFGTNNDKQK